MAEAALHGVDVRDVEGAVGPRAFQRGRAYVKRVLDLRWNAAEEALEATVLGQGSVYETVAYFSSDPGRLRFLDGECSCPVGGDCKHVAAIVLAAVGRRLPLEPRSRQRPIRRSAPEPSWADTLHALVPEPDGDGDPDGEGGVPLALEVTVDLARDAGSRSNPRLLARVVRRGRAGWVKSGISWSGLDSWQVDRGGFAADHVGVLRKLFALHQADTRGSSRGYYYAGRVDHIDLADFDISLWALLDEARRVGLHLVHTNRRSA